MKSSGKPDLPEVFLDRSLGSDEIARRLREVGYPLRTMREVYSEKTAQKLDDELWLKKCSKEGWAVFSKDQGLRDSRTREYRALVRCEIKAFILPSAKMGEEMQIARYVDNRYRIAMKCNKSGPFIAIVERESVPFELHPPSRGG
jgi:uncharacterized protein with PIN domain